MPKRKALVEEIFRPCKEKSSPVLLKFQNGSLTKTHKESTLYFPVKCKEDETKNAIVITSENVYAGVIGAGDANELTDYYICVRNKETNKVRIIPIEQAKLINHIYKEKEKKTFDVLSKPSALTRILRDFGGKKEMRYLSNRQRNAISIDVVKDQLEITVEESSVLNTTEPVVSAEDNVERIRPKFNKDATIIENVFSLYDVIPLELIDRLDEEASALLTTEIEDIPISSPYLQEAIKALKNGPQSNQTLLKLKIIMYMDGLQTLIKTKIRTLKRIELSKITEKVENDIRERFSYEQNNHKMRTSYSNEKALCYYLVLAFLISEKYELDISVLSSELCTPKTKIMKFGHLVNATVKRGSGILALRLPSAVKPMSFAFIGNKKKLK